MKNFQLTERFRFQFRMDAYNIFNHVALGYSNNQGGGGNCVASLSAYERVRFRERPDYRHPVRNHDASAAVRRAPVLLNAECGKHL